MTENGPKPKSKRTGRNKDWLNVHVVGNEKPQSIDWVHKGPPTYMVPYRSASRINQSETTLKYFDPLQTHKYCTHTHTPRLMMGEVSPETSLKNIMIQDMINSKTI